MAQGINAGDPTAGAVPIPRTAAATPDYGAATGSSTEGQRTQLQSAMEAQAAAEDVNKQ